MKWFCHILLFLFMTSILLNCAKSLEVIDVPTSSATAEVDTEQNGVSEEVLTAARDSLNVLLTYAEDPAITESASQALQIMIEDKKAEIRSLSLELIAEKEAAIEFEQARYDSLLAEGASTDQLEKQMKKVTLAKVEKIRTDEVVAAATEGVVDLEAPLSSEELTPVSSSSESELLESSMTADPIDPVASSAEALSVEALSSEIITDPISSGEVTLSSAVEIASSAIEVVSSAIGQANNPPVIDQGAVVNLSMDEDGLFSEVLTATDLDSNILLWEVATSASVGVVSVSGTGNSKEVTYTVPNNYTGPVTFAISVTDYIDSDTIQVNLTVNPVNDPPVYAGGATITGTIYNGALLTMNAVAGCTDPDGATTTFSYAWYSDDNASGYDQVTPVGTQSTFTLGVGSVGSYFYGIVTCTDEGGAEISDSTAYTVIVEMDRALSLQAAAGGSITSATSVTVQGGVAEAITATADAGKSFIGWAKVSGTGTAVFANENAASTTVTVTGGDVVIEASFSADSEPPTTPSGFTTDEAATTNTAVGIKWNAASDNIGVAGYNVFIDGVYQKHVATTSTTVAVSGLTFSRLQVSAVDAAGNESGQSKSIYHIELEKGDSFGGTVNTSSYYLGGLSDLSNEVVYFYNITLAAGSYSMKARMADITTTGTPNQVQLLWSGKASDSFVTQINSNNHTTGGWQSWVYESVSGFSLDAGLGTVWFQFYNSDFNVDWVQLIQQ